MANLEKILWLRKYKVKLSCTEVGKALGINGRTYTTRENGDTEFTTDEAIKLSKVLQTEPKELFPDFFL